MSQEKRNFDEEALTWDEEPRRVQLAKDLSRAIREAVPLSTSTRMMDFGCGTGLVTLPLSVEVGQVTGVDSSRGMLDVLDGKARKLHIGNVLTRQIDVERGERLEGTFDLIVSTMTFHHVQDTARLLGQLAAALAPDGFLCIADLDTEEGDFHENNTGVHHFGFDRGVLTAMIENAGFAEVQAKTAAEIRKPGANGVTKSFSVFLVTGRRARP